MWQVYFKASFPACALFSRLSFSSEAEQGVVIVEKHKKNLAKGEKHKKKSKSHSNFVDPEKEFFFGKLFGMRRQKVLSQSLLKKNVCVFTCVFCRFNVKEQKTCQEITAIFRYFSCNSWNTNYHLAANDRNPWTAQKEEKKTVFQFQSIRRVINPRHTLLKRKLQRIWPVSHFAS